MAVRNPHYQSVREIIRNLAGKRWTDFEWSMHAEREWLEDGLELHDVRNALINAEGVEEQEDECGPKYVVTGKDTEGRKISVVLTFEEEPPSIFVITVWKVRKVK
jgi:uncharacterized DUF497 family protein